MYVILLTNFKFLRDIKSFILPIKVSYWPPKFASGNIDLYHNSAYFSEIRKNKKNFDLSFNSLNGLLLSECGRSLLWLILISPENWIPQTEESSFGADVVVGSIKVVSKNRFSECAWLGEMPRFKNINRMSVALSVSFPDV